jgi:hypothetical protein
MPREGARIVNPLACQKCAELLAVDVPWQTVNSVPSDFSSVKKRASRQLHVPRVIQRTQLSGCRKASPGPPSGPVQRAWPPGGTGSPCRSHPCGKSETKVPAAT